MSFRPNIFQHCYIIRVIQELSYSWWWLQNKNYCPLIFVTPDKHTASISRVSSPWRLRQVSTRLHIITSKKMVLLTNSLCLQKEKKHLKFLSSMHMRRVTTTWNIGSGNLFNSKFAWRRQPAKVRCVKIVTRC